MKHPMTTISAPFSYQFELEHPAEGSNAPTRWSITLSNEFGDTETQIGEWAYTLHTKDDWQDFYDSLSEELEWTKRLLALKPFVRTLPAASLSRIIASSTENEEALQRSLIYVRDYLSPNSFYKLSSLSIEDFEAVKHLCKVQLMQNS